MVATMYFLSTVPAAAVTPMLAYAMRYSPVLPAAAGEY